jgi:capsular exopolysaccharide synthesis family protein
MAEATELGLVDFARIIWRHKLLILALGILAAAATFALDSGRTKVYEAKAQVLLTPTLSQAVSSTNGGTSAELSATDVATDAKVISSPANQRAAANLLKIPSVPSASVGEVGTTNVVNIAVQSPNPAFAIEAANAYARAYITGQQHQAVTSLEAAATQLSSKIATLQSQISSIQAQIATLSAPTPTTSSQSGSASAATVPPSSNPAIAALQSQQNSLVEQQTTLREQATQLSYTAQLAGGGGQIIGLATPPAALVSPHRVRDTALAGGIGLVLGLGVAFLWEFLDDRIRGEEDLDSATGSVPALGFIPTVPEWVSRRNSKRGAPHVITDSASATSPAAEAYRSLRTSIQFIRLDKDVRSIVVTSPYSNEGKTTTVANLAASMAQAGNRVVVLSCDLRKPELHAAFELSNEVGFTSVILGEATPMKALQQVAGYDNLWVMPAGPIPPNPSELLASRRSERLLHLLTDQFDMVLIDTPPVLPVTDAAVLAAYADGTLMVIAAGTTTKKQARRAVEILERVDAAPLGVIVNRIPHRGGNFYYGYGYGYRYGRKTGERPATRATTPEASPDGGAVKVEGNWDDVRAGNGGPAPSAPEPQTGSSTDHVPGVDPGPWGPLPKKQDLAPDE